MLLRGDGRSELEVVSFPSARALLPRFLRHRKRRSNPSSRPPLHRSDSSCQRRVRNARDERKGWTDLDLPELLTLCQHEVHVLVKREHLPNQTSAIVPASTITYESTVSVVTRAG